MNGISDFYANALTRREREILNCLANGLTSKEIANKLFVSKNTVDNHRRNMIRKKGVKRTTEIVCADFAHFFDTTHHS